MVETQEIQVVKPEDLVRQYGEDSLTQIAVRALQAGRDLRMKGFSGSQDALAMSAIYGQVKQTYVVVLSNNEEAAYYRNDLEQLMPNEEIMFFPTSYKKAYEYTKIENANVLQRSETLNAINELGGEPCIIITYPDALNEKVINQRSLRENTLSAKVGEALDTGFMMELLQEYGFKKEDYVYEV
ncbi:MAG: transcription-repair coupling factor (superfamily II helicase), partial [Flammeovirgaceae bacterium]